MCCVAARAHNSTRDKEIARAGEFISLRRAQKFPDAHHFDLFALPHASNHDAPTTDDRPRCRAPVLRFI